MTDNNKPIPIKEWVRRISEEEIPVFAHTARQIAAASKGVDTPVAELAHLILQDSSMTVRILRLANSVYYNPSSRPINTISRGIVLLGFNVVRSMALTIAIIEPLLKGLQHDHVVLEMARAFHAAIQARSIALARGAGDVEEVFIAALLCRLGHITFWCFPYGMAKALDTAYTQWDEAEQAEQAVLGFSLRHLTIALSEEWHLSPLLIQALTKQDSSGQAQDLTQAYDLVLAVEEGWGSIKTKQMIELIADRVELSYAETLEMIQQNAYKAAATAKEYGAEIASKHIPLPDLADNLSGITTKSVAQQPDLQLQMSILRELTAMLHERVDLNAMLGTIMEGIYRALGMERTIIAFIAPENGHLKAKYILGDEKDKLKRCFDFTISEHGQDFFSHALKQKNALWLNKQTRKQFEPIINSDMRQCLGVMEFFVAPIWIGNKGKGIIYADCKYSGRTLTENEFQTFSHFCEYATIAFDLLSRHK